MSAQLERIAEEAKALSPDELRQLRSTVDSLLQPSSDNFPVSSDGRIALSRAIRGKYAHLGALSADFAARKAEEIELEDRRSRQ